MKRPIDIVKKGANPIFKSEVRKKKRPVGGKALARLKQFVQKRNLPFNARQKIVTATHANKKKVQATGSGVLNVPTTSNAINVVQSYTQALSETCIAVDKIQRISHNYAEAISPAARVTIVASPIDPPWRFIGPSSISNGQTYGNSRVVCSGRVAAIAIDPHNSRHILVGSGGGGVWESKDLGKSWMPRTDFMQSLKTGAIAFDPNHPSIVYCGTGEGNDGKGLGQGILKSTDGGTNWTMFCEAPFAGQDFFDLIVDPTDSNHLLAATTGGIYNSIDCGNNWVHVRKKLCWKLAMTPPGESKGEVLAACMNGLFQSTNGGVTFKKVMLLYELGNFSRLAVAISKSNPGKAYAFGVREDTDNAMLWCRPAADETWRSIKPPAKIDISQAWYDWFLEVSPDREDEIYIGAIEAWRGTKGKATWKWTMISTKRGDDIHPDHHCITIDPANAENIFIGNDGGIFFSPNRGKSWQSRNAGLGITEIVFLAQNLRKRNWLMAGTQDNGTIVYTGKQQWEQVADGDGGDCGVNLHRPKVCYHSYYGIGMEKSTSGGKKDSWEDIGPDIDFQDGDIFYPPLEVNGETVAQAGRSVFISRDAFEFYDEIELPDGHVGTAMSIPTADMVYVGTQNGAIYKIIWMDDLWRNPKELARPRPDKAQISDLYVDPANLNRMWATSTNINGNRCFRSDDEGASWVNCTRGLPHDLPMNSIEVDPADPKRVWVAADVGVYQSKDAGITWIVLSKGLPNAIACDLMYNPNEKLLRVGLQNRGVWELDV